TRPTAEEANASKSSDSRPSPTPPVAKNAGTVRVSANPTPSNVAPIPMATDMRGRNARGGSSTTPPVTTSGGGTQAAGACARAGPAANSTQSAPNAPKAAAVAGHAADGAPGGLPRTPNGTLRRNMRPFVTRASASIYAPYFPLRKGGDRDR